ncbi:hypothetical protein ES708_22452 [subsurface metagenome]
MKKLAVILVVILLGVFLLNAVPKPSTAGEMTLPSTISMVNKALMALTPDEMATLKARLSQKELSDAMALFNQWQALVKLGDVAASIILER